MISVNGASLDLAPLAASANMLLNAVIVTILYRVLREIQESAHERERRKAREESR